MNVYLDENCYGGINYYRVMVEGSKYDEFVSTTPLTWKEQLDIAWNYAEALAGYEGI